MVRLSELPESAQRRVRAKANLDDPPPAFQRMNKTEQRYVNEVMNRLQRDGEVIDWRFETVKFRLANNTFYTPDFFVVYADGHIELHETKGWWRDDARVKTKVAAEQYWWFRWRGVQYKRQQWVYEEFN